jgi:UDP-N-acetylglucosamine--N-acetylmuramyl-(pentapeptide) pyrophosphoryl-undecaprenol N-acetylglucosamine transferase
MYPAVAVLQAIREDPELFQALEDTLWIGGQSGMDEEILIRAGLTYQTIPAAGLHGVGLRKLPGNLLQLIRGYWKSRRILREFQPDVLFFTGGYLAVPVALAGRAVPSVLFVPDIEPGLALKTIARLADVIAATAEETRKYFSSGSRVQVTGYPVRTNLREWKVAEALEAFQLNSNLPVLLVFGGSTGARSINQALIPNLPELLEFTQVIHITGKLDWPELQDQPGQLPEKLRDRYRVFPYLHQRMGAAFAAADLAVSRAGASILGEFPLFGLPAVLVPYPHAWHYQLVNAQYLESKGGAVIVQDQDLEAELLPRVQEILQDGNMLEQMSQKVKAAARPDAAGNIARLLFEVGGAPTGEGQR